MCITIGSVSRMQRQSGKNGSKKTNLYITIKICVTFQGLAAAVDGLAPLRAL